VTFVLCLPYLLLPLLNLYITYNNLERAWGEDVVEDEGIVDVGVDG
jgi:hypothetical protein